MEDLNNEWKTVFHHFILISSYNCLDLPHEATLLLSVNKMVGQN